jgi:hypothetical protein
MIIFDRTAPTQPENDIRWGFRFSLKDAIRGTGK